MFIIEVLKKFYAYAAWLYVSTLFIYDMINSGIHTFQTLSENSVLTTAIACSMLSFI